MKRRFRLFFIAFAVAPPLADAAETYASSPYNAAPYVENYVSPDARWQVDRQRGTVSAWELARPVPLWSRDGVVFRSSPNTTNANSTFPPTFVSPVPATAIFGRVYFFLNAPSKRRKSDAASLPRQNDLLLALDPNSQGRLAWICRAQDFAIFFEHKSGPLQFVTRLESLPDDELLVIVQTASHDAKPFAVDAATGTFRPLDSVPPKSQ